MLKSKKRVLLSVLLVCSACNIAVDSPSVSYETDDERHFRICRGMGFNPYSRELQSCMQTLSRREMSQTVAGTVGSGCSARPFGIHSRIQCN